ncbi:MAG TPA: EAL domain-containing protein [Devosiaceae bacterium]|nr:EAL domain-containing protein [Devosiaceae bacterium]
MTKHDDDPFDLLRAAGGAEGLTHSTIKRALEAVRSHLGMQVAYVSEFTDNTLTLKEVDAPGLEHMVKPGDTMSLEDTYCQHILDGRLPEVMQDTANIPLAASLPMTQMLGIRAHISVPIALPDGRTYGMFCCLSAQPEPSLNARDVKMMRAFADLTALQISREMDAVREQQKNTARIRQILDADELSIVYQPIVRLSDNRIVGFECLSRFAGPEKYTPDVWFDLANSVDMGVGLEIAAISKALGALRFLPEDIYITLNASPHVMLSDALGKSLESVPVDRIVLEVTEHAAIDDYSKLVSSLHSLRSRGARLAIDDAGAGYSSLRHILALQPDIIKLDISLTRNVNLDPARSALAAALVHFAGATKSQILAEGVETEEELQALRGLGVDCAQGYYLGRPAPLETAIALAFRQCQQGAKEVA